MASKLTLVTISILTMASPAIAQVGGTSKADARLRKALNAANLKYTEIKDGNFRLQFSLEGDRSHVVFAESKTQNLGIIEVRQIWAIGWRGDGDPTANVANSLLYDSATRKVGAWELHSQNNGSVFAIFNVKVSADCDGAALKAILYGVAQTADELEERLLASDDL